MRQASARPPGASSASAQPLVPVTTSRTLRRVADGKSQISSRYVGVSKWSVRESEPKTTRRFVALGIWSRTASGSVASTTMPDSSCAASHFPSGEKVTYRSSGRSRGVRVWAEATLATARTAGKSATACRQEAKAEVGGREAVSRQFAGSEASVRAISRTRLLSGRVSVRKSLITPPVTPLFSVSRSKNVTIAAGS